MLINDSIQDEQVNEAQSLNKDLEQIQILIAESEKELQSLFRAYLSSLGIITETANSGKMALDCFFDSKKKERPYDAIVLDTHLFNPPGLEVAKKIHSEKPDQKLVIVTTTPVQYLPQDCLKTAGIEAKDILTMPFRMSELMTALRN
jgi:DNA-binding response OmpR family regulator